VLNRRDFFFSLIAPLALTTAAAARRRSLADARGAQGAGGGGRALPPVSYSCPMHAEVVESAPGRCPICGMTLAPVRLALVWSCTLHPEISRDEQGRCPKCGRDLLRVTKAVSFTCPVHKQVNVIDPGKCPICRRTLVEKYSIRPHGDHNPRHGGVFLMASNNWHLEVAHPAASIFRLYVYDEYSKPFSPPGLAARVTEILDPSGKRQDVSIPFAKTPRGYYEARVANQAVPATIAAKVRFEPADKEYRFDFVFSDYSKEPAPRPPR
jgi:Heavy metal binding domain